MTKRKQEAMGELNAELAKALGEPLPTLGRAKPEEEDSHVVVYNRIAELLGELRVLEMLRVLETAGDESEENEELKLAHLGEISSLCAVVIEEAMTHRDREVFK